MRTIGATANHGIRVATGMSKRWTPARSTAPISTGALFSSLAEFHNRARTLNGAAVRLDSLIRANIKTDPTFVDSWNAWFADWSAWFSTYGSTDVNKLTQSQIAWDLDTYTADLTRYEATYTSFQADYDLRARSLGAPLSGPLPPPSAPEVTAGLPWYFWVGITAGVGLLAYLAYQTRQGGLMAERILDKHPEVLSKL